MLQDKKVLVIGDHAIDRYHWCVTKQFNPEGVFPILNAVRTEDRPGMAGNVVENLKSFGLQVNYIHGNYTSIKHRYMDAASRRCLMRIDEDLVSDQIVDIGDLLCYNAIVISDYNKGSVSMNLIQRCIVSGIKVFIDTKIRNLESLKGCTVKINNKEYGDRTSDHDDIIVTLGRQGALYKDRVYDTEQVDAFDVCGAGDTFMAALVAGWCMTENMEKSIQLALKASTIAVQHIGTYALTENDVKKICEFL